MWLLSSKTEIWIEAAFLQSRVFTAMLYYTALPA